MIMNFQNSFSVSIQSNNELYAQVDLNTKRNNRASTESSGGLIDSTILTEVNLNQVLKFEKVYVLPPSESLICHFEVSEELIIQKLPSIRGIISLTKDCHKMCGRPKFF